MEKDFETFKRTDASEAELRESAERLGPVVEAPSFWSEIANDAMAPIQNRRLALVQLVRRHMLPGVTTIGMFAEMLNGAPWLSDGDITVMTAIGGKILVTWSPDNTVIAISLPGNHGAIYLAIEGHYTAGQITATLRGVLDDEHVLAAIIREVGIELNG